jgi:Carboxypeptidase regulatory-like domain
VQKSTNKQRLPSKAIIMAGICLALFIQIPDASARHRHHKKKKEKGSIDYYNPQNGLGGISGKIMGDLKPVQGATVLVTQKDKVFDQATTDENGYYVIKFLAPGRFDLKVTNEGYRTTIISSIPVSADYTVSNDLYLPKFNNAHMPCTPILETFQEHISHLRGK